MEDNRLKQRIVGAIVLVSLAVIFIPMILTGTKTSSLDPTETNIPEKPERDFVSRIIPLDRQAPEPAPVVVEPAPKTPVAEESPRPADDSTAESAATTQPESKPETRPEPKPEPAKPVAVTPPPVVAKTVNAWVVQVGVFTSKDNAYTLRDKLRKQGFDAFVDTQNEGDTINYRVRVGPEVKRESAEATQEKLQKSASLKGFVTKYP